MEETFTAGIRPGGLTEGREIRILICHILSELSEMEKMTSEELVNQRYERFRRIEFFSEK